MTVQLLAFSYWCSSSGLKASYEHPVWVNLLDAWHFKYTMKDHIRQVVEGFQGKLFQYDKDKVVFEFETENDLTQFLLAWS